MYLVAGGFSSSNRAFLTALNRHLPGAFTAADAADASGVDHDRAARLLRQLAAQGWIARVQRGLYTNVPLAAQNPAAWPGDPWTIADRVLRPGYIAGFTALHYWSLTDQTFKATAFITSRPVAHRQTTIGQARLELRHRSPTQLFGTTRIKRGRTQLDISDPERTLADCLDDPSIGHGLMHTAQALATYNDHPQVAWDKLIAYADQLTNRTIFKRLGYLAQHLPLSDAHLLQACRERVSAGISLLDPHQPNTGPINKNWGLRINTAIRPLTHAQIAAINRILATLPV